MKKYYVYMSNDLTAFEHRNYLIEPLDIANPEGWTYYELDTDGFTKEEADRYAQEAKELFPDAYIDVDEMTSYDVVFNDGEKSDSKGFHTYDSNYCMNYISTYNGSNESYFADYKGGVVSIVSSNGDTIYEEEIR